MNSVYVAYSLKGDRYELQFSNKKVFVEKNKWNKFIKEQHDRKEGVSLGGGINVETQELEKIISE